MTEREALTCEMNKLRERGANFSFVLTDLRGNVILCENEDWRFCSQSTIKAPYVCSLLEAMPEIFEKEKDCIKQIITVSSNEAYEDLRERYGDKFLENWIKELKIEAKTALRIYPRDITVLEMAKFWTKMYPYLTEKAPKELKNWFYGTKYSAIYDTLGGKYKTWTKSGWENGIDTGDDVDAEGTPPPEFTDGDSLNDETATNDTGVVFSPKGTYILAIFTDIPTSPHSLCGLVCAIDNLYKVI